MVQWWKCSLSSPDGLSLILRILSGRTDRLHEVVTRPLHVPRRPHTHTTDNSNKWNEILKMKCFAKWELKMTPTRLGSFSFPDNWVFPTALISHYELWSRRTTGVFGYWLQHAPKSNKCVFQDFLWLLWAFHCCWVTVILSVCHACPHLGSHWPLASYGWWVTWQVVIVASMLS